MRSGLGHPRLHLRRTGSTNERARQLAIAGAPHGTLVTAAEQTAGRGRQGRVWSAPPGSSLLCSLVLREPPALLSLIAAVAVCEAIGGQARVKWPNDVVIERARPDDNEKVLAKLAGILIEGRPQEGWAVLGIGVNVAVRLEDLPAEARGSAASLERPESAIEPLLADLLAALARRMTEPTQALLDAWRERDALLGREVSWAEGHGRAEGIDGDGRLLVRLGDGTAAALGAGEVHLASVG
ncbi:MAG TPA: biotin--[acetyl-CoA-carboxylase] ligase [Solirubrobacteraceae bacterium]|nr:biotin--[acetyl-CoA-carboxylase] ligase [Solirubrobacteraceae bacterium]